MGKKKYDRTESMTKARNHLYSASERIAQLANDRSIPEDLGSDIDNLRLLVISMMGISRSIENRLNQIS